VNLSFTATKANAGWFNPGGNMSFPAAASLTKQTTFQSFYSRSDRSLHPLLNWSPMLSSTYS